MGAEIKLGLISMDKHRITSNYQVGPTIGAKGCSNDGIRLKVKRTDSHHYTTYSDRHRNFVLKIETLNDGKCPLETKNPGMRVPLFEN